MSVAAYLSLLGYAHAEARYCWTLLALVVMDPQGRQGAGLALALVSEVEYWSGRRWCNQREAAR